MVEPYGVMKVQNNAGGRMATDNGGVIYAELANAAPTQYDEEVTENGNKGPIIYAELAVSGVDSRTWSHRMNFFQWKTL